MVRPPLMICALCLMVGCGRSTIDYKNPAASFQNLPPLIAAIRSADRVIIHEGLPHDRWEKKQFESELATKSTTTRRAFPFYRETLPPSEADQKALRELICADGAFEVYHGAKACGGFHPDYCLEFKTSGDSIEMLICFGCSEARIFGPRQETYCDIEQSAKEKLKKLLEPYHKNRPARER